MTVIAISEASVDARGPWTSFDIARSVAGANVVVYSPRVLRPGGQFLWVSMGRSAHW